MYRPIANPHLVFGKRYFLDLEFGKLNWDNISDPYINIQIFLFEYSGSIRKLEVELNMIYRIFGSSFTDVTELHMALERGI